MNPNYITPKMLQFRLQKIMDEYVAGVATYYTTNDNMLAVAEEKLDMLKEDAQKMRAKDLHELLRAWENYHRILTAEAHMKHIQFREESRYPGFYYRMDKNFVDEENWNCFVNSIYDKTTQKWTCSSAPTWTWLTSPSCSSLLLTKVVANSCSKLKPGASRRPVFHSVRPLKPLWYHGRQDTQFHATLRTWQSLIFWFFAAHQ